MMRHDDGRPAVVTAGLPRSGEGSSFRAGIRMTVLIAVGLVAAFIAFAATFCIENCPDSVTPRSIVALIVGLFGVVTLVSAPFAAARMSGRKHWFWAGLGSIGCFAAVIPLAAPLPTGFGNMASLMVAELGACAMVAIRAPNRTALAARWIFLSVLLVLGVSFGPNGPPYGMEASILTPVAIGTVDLVVTRSQAGSSDR